MENPSNKKKQNKIKQGSKESARENTARMRIRFFFYDQKIDMKLHTNLTRTEKTFSAFTEGPFCQVFHALDGRVCLFFAIYIFYGFCCLLKGLVCLFCAQNEMDEFARCLLSSFFFYFFFLFFSSCFVGLIWRVSLFGSKNSCFFPLLILP